MFNYTCLPHGNLARISLYWSLRMLSMVVIFFTWNISKEKQSSFLATIPHLKPPPINKQWLTSTMSQGYGVYSCRFVCTGRTIFASEYTQWVQVGEKCLCPEVWPMPDGQPMLLPGFSLGSRAEQEGEPLQMVGDSCSSATWKPPSVACPEWSSRARKKKI